MTRQWVSADAWLRYRGEQEPIRRCLGFEVPAADHVPPPPPRKKREPRPGVHRALEGPSPWPEVLGRIDKVVEGIRAQPKRKLAGRRQALLADVELATEVYRLVQERGITDALANLSVSYQAVVDVWVAYGWPAPFRPQERTGRRTA